MGQDKCKHCLDLDWSQYANYANNIKMVSWGEHMQVIRGVGRASQRVFADSALLAEAVDSSAIDSQLYNSFLLHLCLSSNLGLLLGVSVWQFFFLGRLPYILSSLPLSPSYVVRPFGVVKVGPAAITTYLYQAVFVNSKEGSMLQ